ncbi:glutamate decarboxylase [Thioflavicoccus mobilis 8321]|uniref:Glutamate decarboxylase n=1 Tax=Thioflavicoccus mobilis 8321 TaxID=765912 RepID=L0GY17_9GAMM|nr:glutamate decarboxylase [Thioflavicoccus mobilis]AGA90199.1 glutamate decarboxylase [Thioflavicoccus mobilis 8321]
MLTKKIEAISPEEIDALLTPAYGRRSMTQPVPKYRLADHEMAPDSAYDIVHDELMLDGNARLNMATFVTTWMEPQATKLMAEAFDKNLIDKDEYPQTAAIEARCVNIVSNLFHAPDEGVGASAIGSSEAVMLAGMALKWRWRARRRAQGRPTERPNLILGANVQVVWEKFCRYWEVEPKYIPMEEGRYVITPDEVLARTDENTIGVVAILGTTFTGEFEPIEAIHEALVRQNAESGWEIPLHIDAASGGFVAPFLHPELTWDFRLPLVKSINVSGHKYGLVYPGVGWVVWRSHEDLPEELIFHVNYLGGDMPTFTLNFSRPGNQVVGQYYNFLRLGRAGYTDIMETLRDTAMALARGIAELGPFELISDGSAIPVFAFKLKPEITRYSVFDVSERLRQHGWQVPAYTMPEHAEQVAVLRIVVREGFSSDMAGMLLDDIGQVVEHFEGLRLHEPAPPAPQFAH